MNKTKSTSNLVIFALIYVIPMKTRVHHLVIVLVFILSHLLYSDDGKKGVIWL